MICKRKYASILYTDYGILLGIINLFKFKLYIYFNILLPDFSNLSDRQNAKMMYNEGKGIWYISV